MPVPKRWFHCSRDLNHDPELWAFTDQFGDRALRLWLEILAILERSENQWRLTGTWESALARLTRLSPSTIQKAVNWMLARQWLTIHQPSTNHPPMAGGPLANHWPTIGQLSANDSPIIFSSPNYWKYHKTQGAYRDLIRVPSYPNLPNLPSSEKKKKDILVRLPEQPATVTDAETVLDFLNLKTGRKYRGREANGKPTVNLEYILNRLKAGATIEQCRAVIAIKCRDWKDQDDMKKFLRPATLFNRTKFEQYLGEVGPCNAQTVSPNASATPAKHADGSSLLRP